MISYAKYNVYNLMGPSQKPPDGWMGSHITHTNVRWLLSAPTPKVFSNLLNHGNDIMTNCHYYYHNTKVCVL